MIRPRRAIFPGCGRSQPFIAATEIKALRPTVKSVKGPLLRPEYSFGSSQYIH
jgi:hypothetical protein